MNENTLICTMKIFVMLLEKFMIVQVLISVNAAVCAIFICNTK